MGSYFNVVFHISQWVDLGSGVNHGRDIFNSGVNPFLLQRRKLNLWLITLR